MYKNDIANQQFSLVNYCWNKPWETIPCHIISRKIIEKIVHLAPSIIELSNSLQ